MSTQRVAVTVPYDYSAIPKGCRKPRCMQGHKLAVVDLTVGASSRYPVVYSLIQRSTERRGRKDEEVVTVTERRWGEGQLWSPHGSPDALAKSVSSSLLSFLHDRYGWHRLTMDRIQARIDEAVSRVKADYRVIDGQLYTTAVEHVWVVQEYCRHRECAVIELAEEPTGELVFRLDELEAAKTAAKEAGASYRRPRSTPEPYLEGEISLVRPDLLQRPSGRLHAAKLRGWKVVQSLRGANELTNRLERWLSDPVAAVLPPGLTIEEGQRLLSALLQMRRSLAEISEEQTSANLSVA